MSTGPLLHSLVGPWRSHALYRKVLAIELPWLNGINRPTQKRRIPSVLTKDEVAGLLAQMDGETALIARLLYGTGMRLMVGMRLRIKDVDFDEKCCLRFLDKR